MNHEDPISYPLVSIVYCVKCNWVLRASWYQQELLHTFTSKAKTTEECSVNSILLKPSFTPGTFKVFVRISVESDWIQVWDRTVDGGFPEAKMLKQKIRNLVVPDANLGHSDKTTGHGTLISRSSTNTPSIPEPTQGTTTSSAPVAFKTSHIPTKEDLEMYGSPSLAASHKTFCEECIEKLPPTWEL